MTVLATQGAHQLSVDKVKCEDDGCRPDDHFIAFALFAQNDSLLQKAMMMIAGPTCLIVLL